MTSYNNMSKNLLDVIGIIVTLHICAYGNIVELGEGEVRRLTTEHQVLSI